MRKVNVYFNSFINLSTRKSSLLKRKKNPNYPIKLIYIIVAIIILLVSFYLLYFDSLNKYLLLTYSIAEIGIILCYFLKSYKTSFSLLYIFFKVSILIYKLIIIMLYLKYCILRSKEIKGLLENNLNISLNQYLILLFTILSILLLMMNFQLFIYKIKNIKDA